MAELVFPAADTGRLAGAWWQTVPGIDGTRRLRFRIGPDAGLRRQHAMALATCSLVCSAHRTLWFVADLYANARGQTGRNPNPTAQDTQNQGIAGLDQFNPAPHADTHGHQAVGIVIVGRNLNHRSAVPGAQPRQDHGTGRGNAAWPRAFGGLALRLQAGRRCLPVLACTGSLNRFHRNLPIEIEYQYKL